MARREKAGLPYISKDLIRPEKVAATLPSDEELRDFDILIQTRRSARVADGTNAYTDIGGRTFL